MLQTLSTELNNMQTKSKQQNQRIENLDNSFQETYQLSNNLNNSPSIKHNMLQWVRPEVFNYILIFLDIKQILQFRLLSIKANETVKLMLPIQIHNFQKLIAEQQDEIQSKIQNVQEASIDQNQQQGLKAALNGISGIPRIHFVELKSYVKPPEIIEQIITLVFLAIDPTFRTQKDNWKECKSAQVNQIQKNKLQFRFCRLREKHLQQLEQVNSKTEEQVASKSVVASALLIFLKAVVQLSQQNLYRTYIEIEELQKKIKKEQKLIESLGKINNK
ncbi:unnamed protein product [Paramecium octaurelia]|uniref:Uncharacterized protein n=1 Tax=Paramecium octaurelia TaxID=43137 RepID=A0A8S1W8F2_PAROT|nr:unnamed protein product [Paramecium octaurelia]